MTEQKTVNLVIGFLGSICLGAILMTGLLAWFGKTVPTGLSSAVDVSIGALAAVLASTRTKPAA